MISRRDVLRFFGIGVAATPAVAKTMYDTPEVIDRVKYLRDPEIYCGFEIRWRDYVSEPMSDALVGIWLAKLIDPTVKYPKGKLNLSPYGITVLKTGSGTYEFSLAIDPIEYLAAPTTGGVFEYIPSQQLPYVFHPQPPCITTFSTQSERDGAKLAARKNLMDYITGLVAL